MQEYVEMKTNCLIHNKKQTMKIIKKATLDILKLQSSDKDAIVIIEWKIDGISYTEYTKLYE